ncbi:MAG: beta-N-acetylglucosaminidase domain-containing protein [Opitutaceae bacterium]
MNAALGFRCGVIEGFYGRPWTSEQRTRLLAWMKEGGLNTYLYAPKDDIKHRTLWREPYTDTELGPLRLLIEGCRRLGIEFVYAIAPGLDIRFGADQRVLQSKVAQIRSLGVRTFAILFDDIPDAMRAEDTARFGTFARAQVHVANELWTWLLASEECSRLWFCPTVYCGRFANDRVTENDYLREVGSLLAREIEVLWTGPQIISERIPVDSIRELRTVLGRPPLIWDNLHANDYDLRRMYLGPLTGRSLELREEVSGILSNPNCEFEANFIPLHTLGSFARAQSSWSPEAALADARAAWLPAFAGRGALAVTKEDLELLIGLFYLPHTGGREVEEWIADFDFLMTHPVGEWGARLGRFNKTCDAIAALFLKITELEDRDLCFTFYRLMWEAQWEITPMRGYLKWLQTDPPTGSRFIPRADHRPGIYRGGVVARLQRLMPMADDGAFGHPAR